ncbi:MAG: FISUMP domain-containing protein [bacterium]
MPIVDYEGKVYNTVQIGNQCWLKENLNVGLMIDGRSEQKNNNIKEKYCYNDNESNCATKGGFYQWAEAIQYQNGATNSTELLPAFTGHLQGICPTGWHIPSIEEFETLSTSSTNNNNTSTLKAKGQGTGSGSSVNTGFSALLSGTRSINGNFDYLNNSTYLWCSSEYNATTARYHYLRFYSNNSYFGKDNKQNGFSVRCLKDNL